MSEPPPLVTREAVALGLPGALVAASVVLVMLLRLAGVPPLEPPERMTLSEAAALESDADVVRLLQAGADPNAPARVRRSRIRAVGADLTPLEAAMTSRHVSVMTLLIDGGARLDPEQVSVLWCLALSHRNADAQAWLRSRSAGPFPSDCSRVRMPEVAR